jgi:pimeloyl-ACP methyl ester carboxylesterase
MPKAEAHRGPSDPRELTFLIDSGREGLNLFLRRLPAAGASRHGSVLYLHGATFPSALSIAYRFDGCSWRDALSAAGFDVWVLDFLGFGGSDRYPEMNEGADAHGPDRVHARQDRCRDRPPPRGERLRAVGPAARLAGRPRRNASTGPDW